MRTYTTAALLTLPLAVTAARFLHSIPEDTYAFPKYRVLFLNRLPLLNETAERWLKQGLRGGELEFLDQPWKDDHWHTPSSPKEIDSGDARDGIATSDPSTANYTLEHMRMGPRDSYLCFIPKPADNTPPVPEEVPSDFEITPARSWSLLQPLSGTCLYHRQGWFTYSYCHNDQIRQFKELAQTPTPNAAGGHRAPEEDPEWESYTLGKAPKPGADLTVTEQNAQAANLELARSATSRYLVQRWGDGTLCDKTGRPREVEVQFHCSMTMTDTVLFVKEAKTCSYVLVIHTPRLCGEPGFKSRRDTGEEAHIRCREVVDAPPPPGTSAHTDLPDTDQPVKLPRRKAVLPPPVEGAQLGAGKAEGKGQEYGELLRRTLEAIMGGKDGKSGKVRVEEVADGKNGVVYEIIEELDTEDGEGEVVNRFAEALRDAGYDITAEKITLGSKNNKKKGKEEKEKEQTGKQGKKAPGNRDEL